MNLRATGLHRQRLLVGGYRTARAAAARLGVQWVVKSYYSPIPDLRAVPESVWTRRSPLHGVALDLPAAWDATEAALERFGGELRVGDGGVTLPNESYSTADSYVLYALLRAWQPARIVELGSGHSTLAIAQAVLANARDGAVADYEVVDPYPTVAPPGTPGVTRFRTERAEALPPERFAELQAGDVLFVDTTHTVKVGSDVNRIVLDVLPTLAPGVRVHFHDIFLPYEYPREWAEDYGLYWSEQYLLQAFLTGNAEWEVLCPLHAMLREDEPRLARHMPAAGGGALSGGAFWIRRRPA